MAWPRPALLAALVILAGAIAPGRYADLIAVDAEPLTDIRTLENVAVVIKGGQIVRGGPAATPQ